MSADRKNPKSMIPVRLWPLLGLNFFMADMQSGIGPFIGVFLQAHGWTSGLIGTAMTFGNVAGMAVTTPIGGFIDASNQQARMGRSCPASRSSSPPPSSWSRRISGR